MNYLNVQIRLFLPDFIIHIFTCISTTWIQCLLTCCHICFLSSCVYRPGIRICVYMICSSPLNHLGLADMLIGPPHVQHVLKIMMLSLESNPIINIIP